MNKYTIHCTEEQTRKAFELGAPLEQVFYNVEFDETFEEYHLIKIGCKIYEIPTAEQMLVWLEEQGVKCFILQDMYDDDAYNIKVNGNLISTGHPQYDYTMPYDTLEEAAIAAIDAALEYLTSKK